MKYLSIYHRKYLLAFVITVIVLSGCSKDNGTDPAPDPTPDPPGNEEPLRVMQSIYTHEFNNELLTDTITFTYDDQGRVTSKHVTNGNYTEEYTYTGDKLTSLKNIGADSTAEVLNEAVYSADGDTIMLDLRQNGGSTDTVQLTYIFNNNQQTDFWTYLHFRSSCMCSERHLQKEKWYYNSQNNIVKTTWQTLLDAEEQDRVTVSSWDDKKNPKNGQPKLNALALSLNTPLESFSLHNPTSYTDGVNTYEVEMTYNDEGYPLTFKLKDKNYISTKLIYNR